MSNTSSELAQAMLDVMTAADLPPEAELRAIFEILHCMLLSVECPGCRRQNAMAMARMFVAAIESALEVPSEQQDHVH